MAKPFRLQPLLDLASHRSDSAAKYLSALKNRWSEEEQKLETLYRYREEYRAKLKTRTANGMHAVAWRDFRLFLEKIENAIMQQLDAVAQAKQTWELGKREWLQQRRKLKAYDTLAQRHRRNETRRQAGKDQTEQDEFASTLVRQRAEPSE
ncbi:MAG: flagellar export protein FliJ [Burkholderiales bacterium]